VLFFCAEGPTRIDVQLSALKERGLQAFHLAYKTLLCALKASAVINSL
jgi:hypothetical protein